MAGVLYQENTIDATAHVLAQIERRRFLRHTNSDDTGGFLDGAGIWTISPRRFTWTVEDTFREVLLDVTAPDTPSNRAKSNSLSTGPNFTFPLSSTNSAVIGGRYGRFDIENSTSANQRYTTYVRGVHALAAQSTLSLNYEAARVYFEPEAQFPKIFREDWFARYETHSGLNGAAVDLGTTRVTRYTDTGLTGRLARLTLSEALSSRSTLRLGLSDQISDTYSDQIAGVVSLTAPMETGVATTNGAASGDLYHSERGYLAYANIGGRFEYTLQGYTRRVDFETLDQDYHEGGALFTWTWVYSGATRFNATMDYARRSFESLNREDEDRNFFAGVDYRLNRNVTITMQGGRTERQSTAPSSSFVDNRVLLLLGYSTGPLYSVQSRR
ncbi:MAG: outer membrane beta-barrel protein [Burkholderiales bacterium]